MTEDEWLDACADEPDDDLRRYAFADWLDEHGDADRAELIRLQVALSRVPESEKNPAQVQRAGELLGRYRTKWLERPRVVVVPKTAWHFVRGLPAALIVSDQELGDAGAQALAAAPQLAQITELFLGNDRIGVAGAQALAGSRLTRLTKLVLGLNPIGDAGAQALAVSPHLPRLRKIHLNFNQIGDAGAQALAASPYLAGVAILNVQNNVIGDAGKRALRRTFGDRVQL